MMYFERIFRSKNIVTLKKNLLCYKFIFTKEFKAICSYERYFNLCCSLQSLRIHADETLYISIVKVAVNISTPRQTVEVCSQL
jgi:hypothetical protein